MLLVAAIAEHVAHLLHGKPRVRLVDAATLAVELGVSRDFIYTHASELGGERIGDGPRGRLRFDLDQALAAWASRSAGKGPQGPPAPASTRGRRRQAVGNARLLPVREATTHLQISGERA
jgi:hypothetical protein